MLRIFRRNLRQRAKLKESMYREISKAVVSMAADNDLKPFLKLEEKVIGRRRYATPATSTKAP
ncbi:MAG: hypothetical protein J5I98_17970 [Phaeodactylibacter sp.]|nr:hypothetical protein [Phaeodactylibacter sp.]